MVWPEYYYFYRIEFDLTQGLRLRCRSRIQRRQLDLLLASVE
jgi:hypothetical protein